MALILVVSTWACGESGSTSTEKPAAANTQAVTAAATKKPEAGKPTEIPAMEESPTAVPTDVPPTEIPPTEVPEAEYKEPVVLLEFEGEGEIVTDNYEFPPCFKTVFYWTASAGAYGSASLILRLHNVETERDMTLVNEFGMDTSSGGISGSALQPLVGGEYFFSSENTDEPWALQVVCEDGAAPVASGELAIEGFGNIVTENYELPKCTKSVFLWSVDPSSSGSAALILTLCSVEGEKCDTIVNEFKMDLPGPLEGEALERISGGTYFLVAANTSGRSWRVSWECRD